LDRTFLSPPPSERAATCLRRLWRGARRTKQVARYRRMAGGFCIAPTSRPVFSLRLPWQRVLGAETDGRSRRPEQTLCAGIPMVKRFYIQAARSSWLREYGCARGERHRGGAAARVVTCDVC